MGGRAVIQAQCAGNLEQLFGQLPKAISQSCPTCLTCPLPKLAPPLGRGGVAGGSEIASILQSWSEGKLVDKQTQVGTKTAKIAGNLASTKIDQDPRWFPKYLF